MNEELRRLFTDAYLMAERQGKPGWRRMNIGVLKNRLLVLTRGEFDEGKYGKQRFRDLIATVPELLRIDDSTIPANVELIAEPGLPAAREPTRDRKRIRPDLWRAVVDYSSGKRYVWDTQQGLAREAFGAEELEALPTITQPELAEWRAEFAAKVADTLAVPERVRVDDWQAKGLSTSALPTHLHGLWYEQLTDKIERRLNVWFEHQKSRPPEISALVQANESDAADGDVLRAFIIDCVGLMSKIELDQIQLPATALLRLRQRRNGTGDS
jgi:hypothetical protein